jgi:hypothetical protein
MVVVVGWTQHAGGREGCSGVVVVYGGVVVVVLTEV